MRSVKQMPGFTLLELLAVIAIIAILATIAAVGISGAVKRGRDAVRERDMTNVKQALELYNQDNGSYPSTNYVGLGDTTNGLVPNYIKELPKEKNIRSGGEYTYKADDTGENYVLVTQLEYDATHATLNGPLIDNMDCHNVNSVAAPNVKGNGVVNKNGAACFRLTND